MNPDIRPQDDLFGHVNGSWLESTEIPQDRSSWGPFVELADGVEKHVREMIEACARGEDDSDEGRKIGAAFTSFMDEAQIERLGTEPLQPLFEAIDAITDKDQLAAFIGWFERRGGGGLFGVYIDIDARNSERYLVNLTQGGLGLPDESYYRDDKFAEIREKYVDYTRRLLELAGRDDAAQVAGRVLELETRIAKGHWERHETRDVQKTYNLTTHEELRTLLPAFDWSAYAEAVGGRDRTFGESLFAESVVRQPSFFTHLQEVFTETPLEAFKEMLVVKAIRSLAGYLPDEFVETNFDFYGRTLNGTPELRARWKRGISFVEGTVGEAVGKRYVERHFPPESKAMMDGLVANLLEAYRRSITDLDWMGEETKQRAFDKLDTFNPKIGYPDKWRDYSPLQLSADDLIGNVLASAAFDTDHELRKIGGPVDRDEWLMLPHQVNAYYKPTTNEICFPAGILQRPFFAADGEAAENYGGIGAVIGHEIGHGFDDQGAQYDGAGNLNDWWTADDKSAFEVKSKALIEQYDAYEPRNLPGEHVNGALTVGENIGDLGGLTIAHKAYAIALEDAPEDVDTPADGKSAGEAGITGSQRLFMNWAYCWRTKRRKEQELQLLTIDPHSPAEFRANIVRNLDEFHAAFDTTDADGLWLDPEERVRIW